MSSADKSLSSRIGAVATASSSNFDGVSINVSQHDDREYFDESLRACDEHSLRLIFELNLTDTNTVGITLEALSKSLLTIPNITPDMIVFHAPSQLNDVDKTLSYLRGVLPLTAKFLESHPTIGSAYGRLNAHGNALNDHVIGACHHFPCFAIPQLADLLDVYLPTRLALSSQQPLSPPSEMPSYMLEAVVQNTDMVFVDVDQPMNTLLWNEAWKAQQLDGAQETYVCIPEMETDQLTAEKIRRIFLDIP